jgi:tetratricopeptide (TPR) repeat protein
MKALWVFTTTLACVACFACSLAVSGQSRVNSSGTGGMHTIQGRVYLPSGRMIDNSIKVELQSSRDAPITVYTDVNGAFVFRALAPGNYSVVVEAGESFEVAREYITIDTEAQGNVRITPTPKIVTVPIYLQLKRGVILRNDVINAKWASVPDATINRFKRAVELMQANKSAEAEAAFRQVIAMTPSFAPAYTELGKLLLHAGKAVDAVAVFKDAIRYDEADFDAHLSLGIAYLNLRKYLECEPELVAAAYLNRAAVTPHYYLGILFVMKDDLDIARKAFETARDLKGGRSLPNIHKYLGRIYMKKEMEKEALQELETYLKLAPKAQDAEKVKKDISDIKAKHPVKNAFV